MRRKEHVWWITATVISLAAFSFFAGLGVRAVLQRVVAPGGRLNELSGYPRVASAAPGLPGDADLRPATLYLEVLNKLRLYYVEPLPAATELTYGSVSTMLNSLKDPNTRVVSRLEMEALQKAAVGEYTGIGAILTLKGGPGGVGEEGETRVLKTITVVAVPPGTPAARAGLQPGDRIVELDGQWISPVHLTFRDIAQLTDNLGPQDGPPLGSQEVIPPTGRTPEERERLRQELAEERRRLQKALDLSQALQQLLAPREGRLQLLVERAPGRKTSRITVELASIRAPVFESRRLDETTGYLRLLGFHAGTAEEVRTALAGFQTGGVRNLIVDLRSCAGGTLENTLSAAAPLLGEAKFAILRERDENRRLILRPLFTRGGPPVFAPRALRVLVDRGTAGTGELLAAALRDHLGGQLVGAATFGDGTEQELIRLENGAGVSITRARMLTSRSTEVEGVGVKPDLATTKDALAVAQRGLQP